jgi:hypothetical protein
MTKVEFFFEKTAKKTDKYKDKYPNQDIYEVEEKNYYVYTKPQIEAFLESQMATFKQLKHTIDNFEEEMIEKPKKKHYEFRDKAFEKGTDENKRYKEEYNQYKKNLKKYNKDIAKWNEDNKDKEKRKQIKELSFKEYVKMKIDLSWKQMESYFRNQKSEFENKYASLSREMELLSNAIELGVSKIKNTIAEIDLDDTTKMTKEDILKKAKEALEKKQKGM